MGSIGEILKQEREGRGLSLHDVHEATKITSQYLSALEEDRFDSFPNKVYARAFLRDYANFLSLNSSDLLTRYEDEWSGGREVEQVVTHKSSAWGVLFRVFAVVIVLGILSATAYYGVRAYQRKARAPKVETGIPAAKVEDGATLPRVEPVAPKPAAPSPKPAAKPASQPVAKPAPVPDKLTLDVATLRTVWWSVTVDGKKAAYGMQPKGSKTFEAKKDIVIRVGQGNAVQYTLNGKSLGSAGPDSNPVTRTFTLPKPTAAQAPTQPASAATPAPAPKPASGVGH